MLLQSQNQHIRLALFFCLIICFSACNKSDRKISRGWYFWKTKVSITNYEKERLQALKATEMYVRFFDVDAVNNKPVPIAIADLKDLNLTQNITPVVYITQKALNSLQWNTTADLAKNIAQLLSQKCNIINLQPRLIQVDCDWTARNKNLYFRLLNDLKTQDFFKDKKISVTIRMHQIKYDLTSGFPPVDRGLLMCYNMGNLRQAGKENSIINATAAFDYLKNIGNYPLPLDVALPFYDWSLLFDDSKFLGILGGVSKSHLEESTIFKKVPNSLYVAIADTVWMGFKIKKGNTVRYENSNIKEIDKIANFVSRRIKTDSFSVLFYHCDSTNISKYTNHELEKTYRSFE